MLKPFKTLTISLLAASLLLGLAPTAQPTNAQDTPAETQDTTDSLRQRIQDIVEQQEEKVESVLDELTNERRGFVGQVVRVSESTLGLDVRGATRIVPIDASVVLMKNGSAIKTENIEVGNWALVLGLGNADSFVPKKITFSTTSLLPKSHVVYLGSIKTIKSTGLDFQPRGQDQVLTADVTRNTVFQDSDGEEVELEQFTEDDQVLLAGNKEGNDTVITVVRALAPLSEEAQ